MRAGWGALVQVVDWPHLIHEAAWHVPEQQALGRWLPVKVQRGECRCLSEHAASDAAVLRCLKAGAGHRQTQRCVGLALIGSA